MAAGDGLISMTPSSITHSGTSASINADGGVDFDSVTSLSLNGVFTGNYDNYLIVISCSDDVSESRLDVRLRASGSDASSGNYSNQYVQADNTTINALQGTGETQWRYATVSNTQRDGMMTAIYGPFLANATAFRTVLALGANSAEILDRAGSHNLSTSYDGLTFISASNAFTGNVHVFGYEE